MTAPTLLAQPEHHGLVDGMGFEEYLAVEALSAGSARKLVPPSCPALFRQDQLHPQKSDRLDLGKVAHAVILEDVDLADIAVDIPGSWATKGPKDAKAAALEAGLIPMHSDDYAAVIGMVRSVRRDPRARALLDPATGKPEQSMFWTDERHGVPRKGRVDFLPERRSSGRLILPDLKTAASAEKTEFAKSAANYGYNQQAAGYTEGLRLLDIDDDAQVLFVVVEVKPPYLVNVIELDETAMEIAVNLNHYACGIYAECTRTGRWGGYGDGVDLAVMPSWYLARWEGITR